LSHEFSNRPAEYKRVVGLLSVSQEGAITAPDLVFTGADAENE
jgi:hypothetical protein